MTKKSSSKAGEGRTVLIGPVRWDVLCASAKALLTSHGFTVLENDLDRPYETQDVLRRVRGVDAVVSGVEKWGDEAFSLAPDLRVIARLGVGLDNIDLTAARRRGIDVVNVPGGNAAAVAELALDLTLSVLRRLPEMNASVRAGGWDRYLGRELGGKSVGLVGFGATARAFARRLAGFDVTIKAFDPFLDPGAAERLRVVAASLDEVAGSDVVSVHAPLLPSTHHVIDASFLAAMPRGAVLINTSRGPLVDQGALVAALGSGHLGGAGLDVFEHEPTDATNPLWSFDNVVAAPHAAADTVEAYERIGMASAQAIVDVFSGRTPANIAN